MYCYNCGKQIADGTKFCPECGAKLNPTASGNVDVSAPSSSTPVTASVPSQQQLAPDKKYCLYCAAQIPQDAVICIACGRQVAEMKQAAGPAPQVVVTNVNTNTNVNSGMGRGRQKSKWTAFILCFLFGIFGIHKFYEGKIGMGLLYLFTFGLFGIGVLVDLIRYLLMPGVYYYVW